MAVILEGVCCVSEMREGEPLIEGTLRIWNRIGRATGAQAISLRVMEFAPGLSPAICNEGCDEILYVLDEGWERGHPVCNEVSTASVFINGHSYDIAHNSGIYLRPDEALANPGPHPLLLVNSQCPDPDRVAEFIPPLTAPSSDSTPPKHPPLVRLVDCPSVPTADRWYRVLIDDEVGSTQVTQFVGSIPPGRAPDHFHNYEAQAQSTIHSRRSTSCRSPLAITV